MFTPKRVLILLGSFVFFTTLFGFYFHYLGYLDGLPELPERFRSGTPSTGLPPVSTAQNNKIFEDAFGPECDELKRPIHLFLRSRGLAFATKKFEPDADGRVKLTPFSAVVYKNSGGSFPEINTVRSEIAYLTLDRPVSSMSELASRKIIGVELVSSSKEGIQITNNRRTEPTSDDINVRIMKLAPSDRVSLFFDDAKNLIWSEGAVTIFDGKTSPPTRIDANGMTLHLARSGASPSRGKSSGKGENISGVELLTLNKNVRMLLYTDSQSGFLGGTQNDAGKTQNVSAPPSAKKSQIAISTDGKFEYDMIQEQAHFQCDRASPLDQQEVTVTRSLFEIGKLPSDEDVLKCEDLVLYFRKSTHGEKGDKEKGDKEKGEKEIEKAIARGKHVQVKMIAEKLDAQGTDMLYIAATDTSGAQTTIKGQPMRAEKDGHTITAPELYLVGGDKKGMGQEARAFGEGQIDMLDSTHPGKYTQHAFWKDEMNFVKINKNGLLLDKLDLKGTARFEDDVRQQTLRAQDITVWLEPAGPSSQPAGGLQGATVQPAASVKNKDKDQGPLGTSNQKLHRLEASRDVTYFGPDVHIEHCEYLVITTRDREGKPHTIPPQVGSAPPRPADKTQTVDANRNPLDRMNGGSVIPGVPGELAPQGTEPPAISKNRPIRLWAREVRISVFRFGAQYEMDNLIADDDVHVVQEGETAKDKGVDIQGSMLNLVQHEQGKILYVDGDDRATGEKRYGRLLMNDMLLVAPKISINQKDNIAQGEGKGYLNMPSNSNLDGTKTARSDARMTVHWNERMEFNGRTAIFHGGVQAVQDNSNLTCKKLQVTMDRDVSFKEGQKDAQTAKVDKIVCEGDCFILERIIDPKTGQIVRLQRGQFRELAVDNIDGKTRGFGPGVVSSFSKESGDSKNPIAGKKQQIEQTKLTNVKFRGWLWTVTHENTRESKFYDYVEVYHFPAAHPDVEPNPTGPPKDGFYLRCHLLKVYARPVNGKTAQLMEAKHQVVFQSDEFFGRADVVKFDEADDVIVFDAEPGNIVTITKMVNGQPGQTITGSKILYNRKTGEFKVTGGRSLSGRN